MPENIIYYVVYLGGIFISSIAQILLKKSTMTKANSNIFSFTEKHFNKFYIEQKNKNNGIVRFVKKNKNLIIDYLNIKTILAYFILFSATFITIYAYKCIPLSFGPILGTFEYIFVAILSALILKEKINKQKLLGLCVIIIGIIVFSLKF